MIQRPSAQEHDPYFSRYISLVPDGPILDLLGVQTQDTRAYFEGLTEENANYRYASDKWSIKEVLGHLIDCERVFAYRALAIARGEKQSLPGIDQNEYALNAGYGVIPIQQLVQQYTALRVSTFYFFQQIPEKAWITIGTADGKPISVRALAYIIAGHERHHMNVLAERYEQNTRPVVN